YSYLLELYKIADMVTHKKMVIIIKSNIILTPSPHSHIACTLHQSLLYSNLYPPCQTLRINGRTLGLFCKPHRVPRICSCENRQPSVLFHYYIHCSSFSASQISSSFPSISAYIDLYILSFTSLILPSI